MSRLQLSPFKVYDENGKLIDTVFFGKQMTAGEVAKKLNDMAEYPCRVTVKKINR